MNGKLKDCLVERGDQDAIFELGLGKFLCCARGIVFNLQESVTALLLSNARLTKLLGTAAMKLMRLLRSVFELVPERDRLCGR